MGDAWVEEQNKLLNMQINHKREPLKYVKLHFCYVGANDTILRVETKKHIFEQEQEQEQQQPQQLISEATILNIIDNHKKSENVHFTFQELSMFHVDLEPENINSLDPAKTTFFKTFPFVSDVQFSNSVFIFHPINSLFFVFKQKSSLKQTNSNSSKSIKKNVVFSSKKHTRRFYNNN